MDRQGRLRANKLRQSRVGGLEPVANGGRDRREPPRNYRGLELRLGGIADCEGVVWDVSE